VRAQVWPAKRDRSRRERFASEKFTRARVYRRTETDRAWNIWASAVLRSAHNVREFGRITRRTYTRLALFAAEAELSAANSLGIYLNCPPPDRFAFIFSQLADSTTTTNGRPCTTTRPVVRPDWRYSTGPTDDWRHCRSVKRRCPVVLVRFITFAEHWTTPPVSTNFAALSRSTRHVIVVFVTLRLGRIV